MLSILLLSKKLLLNPLSPITSQYTMTAHDANIAKMHDINTTKLTTVLSQNGILLPHNRK